MGVVNTVFLVKYISILRAAVIQAYPGEDDIRARRREENDFQRLTHGFRPLFKKMSSSKEKKKKLYTNFPEVSVATSKLTNKNERHNGQFLKSGQIELEWHVRSQFNQKLLQVLLLVKLESKNNSYTIEPTLRTPT